MLMVLGAGMTAMAALGAYIVLMVTIRGHEVTVPDMISMTPAEAEAEAVRHELSIEIVGSRSDPRVSEGKILEQEPRPGSRTRPQRVVRVLVSLGQGTLAVPVLAGATLRKAQVTIEQLGLRLGSVAYIPSFDGPADGVIAQRPAAGSRRQKGDPVDLLVSRGAPERVYVMPALTGLAQEEATSLLRDARIRVGLNRRRGTGGPRGVVVEQHPAEGFPLHEHDAVQLVVAE
jgi:beta-lactam-binding protein with PASTA domain